MDNDILLKELLQDTHIGAGNFLYKLYQKATQKDLPLIYLDKKPLGGERFPDAALSLNYMIDSANRYASYYHRIGLTPKEPVVLFFEESIHYFLMYVALTRIGSIPVFMNGLLDNYIVGELTIHSSAKYLITDRERINWFKNFFETKNYPIHLLDLDEILTEKAIVNLPWYHHHEDQTVLLTHTSGTTGIPKIVQFTHGAMFFGIRKQIQKQPGKRILSLLPHSHASSITILMSSLLRLVEIKIQAQKDLFLILKSIEDYKPDLLVAFPKILVDLCRHDLSNYDLNSIQYWLSTGDANHETHIRKLIANGHHWKDGIKKKGAFFIDNLGSSEFSFAFFRNIHTPDSNHYDRCIGVPFGWVECGILAEDGSFLPPGQIGYLGVKAKSVTKGYWNNTYLTEKNYLNGFWLTGDLAYQDENGVFYHVDRISDKIETDKGIFYTCQAEEWILKNLSYIFDISFVGFKNTNYDIEIIAMVELQKDKQDLEIDFLKQQINECLNRKNWPTITKIQFQSAHQDVGITGKKLKRKIRSELSTT